MQRIGSFLSAVVLVVSLLVSSQTQSQQIGRPEAGRRLAEQICAQCHAVEKQTFMSPNSAAPRFDVIANTPGMTATALSVALQTSHRDMPNITLDPDELSSVILYILSLKRAD